MAQLRELAGTDTRVPKTKNSHFYYAKDSVEHWDTIFSNADSAK
jgi:hypothetical protein